MNLIQTMHSLMRLAHFSCLMFVFLAGLSVRYDSTLLAQSKVNNDCKVTASVTGGPSPNPALLTETVITKVTASPQAPTAGKECKVKGPTWAWAIDKDIIDNRNKVEFKGPSETDFKKDDYLPTLTPTIDSPDATLTCKFPKAGSWKITLKVTGSWTSEECGSCNAESKLVVGVIDVSPCDFTGVLTPSNNFDGRSLTRLGLGETGTLSTRPATGVNLADLTPLIWAVASGSDFISISNIDTSNGTADFQAKDKPGQAILTLKSNTGCTATLTVDVIAPTGAYQVQCGDKITFKSPVFFSVTTKNNTYLLPKDVSFNQIRVREGTCPGVGTGSQEKDKTPHPSWPPVSVSDGNIVTGCLVEGPNPADVGCGLPFDGVRATDYLTIGEGTFIWDIPWEYSIGSVSNQPFTKLLYRVVFDGKRGVTISKGGVSASYTAP